MEKIDLEKLGVWKDSTSTGFNSAIAARQIAEKVNELIDYQKNFKRSGIAK